MFDSLALENPRRKWATMMSFMLETAFVGLAITTPLAFTEKLQLSKLSDVIVAPTSTAIDTAPQPSEVNPADATNRSEVNPDETLIAPMVIPSEVHRLVDTQQVAPSGVGEYVPGAVPGGGDTNPFMRRLIESIKPPVVVSASVPRTPVKISVLDPGFLVHRVEPIYPHNAILTRTEGSVTLTAVIDTTGRITQLHATSGHPFLIQAALDAVRQWRYKPYILNNVPVEVETQISVNFYLNR